MSSGEVVAGGAGGNVTFGGAVLMGADMVGSTIGGAVLSGAALGGVGYLMSFAVTAIFPSCGIAPMNALVIGASTGVIAGGIKGLSWSFQRNFPEFYEKYKKLFDTIEKILIAIVPAIAGFFISNALGFGVTASKMVWYGLASTATIAIGIAGLAAVALLVYGIYKLVMVIKAASAARSDPGAPDNPPPPAEDPFGGNNPDPAPSRDEPARLYPSLSAPESSLNPQTEMTPLLSI